MGILKDHEYDLYIMHRHPHAYQSTGAVRRARRQLNRAWAVSGRANYGVNSIQAYCAYATCHGFLTGEPTCYHSHPDVWP